jgi:hypothetical protein
MPASRCWVLLPPGTAATIWLYLLLLVVVVLLLVPSQQMMPGLLP